jgi:multiubiquitin
MEPTAKAKPRTKTITIFVNNRPVEIEDRRITGAEIKAAADVPSEFKLFNAKGEEIANDTEIKVHPKERFTAISGQDVS